jgi:transcriptional regulator with XRE-family HTH domain
MNKSDTLKFSRAIGSLLKSARETIGMTKVQVASKLKVKRQRVQNVERGSQQGRNGRIPTPLSVVNYCDICKVLGINAGQVVNLALQKVRRG